MVEFSNPIYYHIQLLIKKSKRLKLKNNKNPQKHNKPQP